MAMSRTSFSAKDTSELFNLVSGKSSLAKLCGAKPIGFNGNQVFTFNFDNEASIVAENGAKTTGGATVEPVSVVPVKFEYGARVPDEFLYGAEEVGLEILEGFKDGAAKKFAKALDIAAMHGINPRTGAASAVVGNNHFDYLVSQTETYDATDPDAALQTVISAVRTAGNTVSGIALAPAYADILGQIKNGAGVHEYPEFRFGGNPDTFYGMGQDTNGTVSAALSGATAVDYAIVGDFANRFRWGFSKDIELEVIEYGNPDNDQNAGDLKGHNQVYLRCETYIGWGIIDANAFAMIKSA